LNLSLIERQLGIFSIAFAGVAIILFLFIFAVTPTICDLGPMSFIRMPFAQSASVIHESETDLTIYIRPDQSLFVGKLKVPFSDLSAELARIARIYPDRHVLIAADGSVPFAAVQQVLRASRDSGFTRITFVTFRGNQLQASTLRTYNPQR